MKIADLPNLPLLQSNAEITALLNNINYEYSDSGLPDYHKDALLNLLSTFSVVGPTEKRLVQECMRRLQLSGDTFCFGVKNVFFHLCPEYALKGVLDGFFGIPKGQLLLKEFVDLGKIASSNKSTKTAKLKILLENNVHSIDKNLRLAEMPLRKHICWLFTTGYGELGSLEKIVASVQDNQLPDALGLPGWPGDKKYFLFKLNMPEDHMLYRPTIMDADFPNQYYQSGGKTRPRNPTHCVLGEQSEWVVRGRPSFLMIEEVFYVEVS